MNNVWFKKLDQIPLGEEVELQYPEDLLHGATQFCFEIEISDQEKHA